MRLNIAIPTFDREHLLSYALESSLAQRYDDFTVTVVDDGSTDGTREFVERYFDHPELIYIRLASNHGTAVAKNVALALSPYDAITFHDSDDEYDERKLLLQARALKNHSGIRDPDTVWDLAEPEPCDIAVCRHRFIRLDGKVYEVGRPVSLVDDFFPNLSATTDVSGQFLLPNPGLYRKEVFERIGGFEDSLEEDRDLRNRSIVAGLRYVFLDAVLITKFEIERSLTIEDGTGFSSEDRKQHREEKRRQARALLQGRRDPVEPIDLSGVEVDFIHNADRLEANDIPMTSGSERIVQDILERWKP